MITLYQGISKGMVLHMNRKCAIGTWGWGNGFNGSGMIFGTIPNKERITRTFRSAVENNMLLFDTAPVYGGGASEKLLGNLSKNNSEVVISTKYFPVEKTGLSNVKRSVNQSLSRLKREHIDILWLHQPTNIENNMRAMAELVIEGKVKHIGISNADIHDIRIAQNILSQNNIGLYGVQNHYSLIYRQYEDNGLLDYCKQNDIVFWAYMLLEQGALTGTQKLPTFSRRGIVFGKSRLKKLTTLTDKMSELADKYHTDIAGIAVAHSYSKGMLPIVGATKPEHIEKLVKSIQIELSTEEILLLEELADKTEISIKASWEK